MTAATFPYTVIPAQAGIHLSARACGPMDPRLRGDDGQTFVWRTSFLIFG